MQSIDETIQFVKDHTSLTEKLLFYGNQSISNTEPKFVGLHDEYQFSKKLSNMVENLPNTPTGHMLKGDASVLEWKHSPKETFLPLQQHILDPDYHTRKFIEPFDLIVSRCSDKLNFKQNDFVVNLLNSSFKTLGDGKNYVLPSEILKDAFDINDYYLMINTLDSIMPKVDKTFLTAKKEAHAFLTEFGDYINKIESFETFSLDSEVTQEYLKIKYGLHKPIDELYNSVWDDMVRMENEWDKKTWKKLSSFKVTGDNYQIESILNDTIHNMSKKIADKGLMSSRLIDSMKKRLSIAPTPEYLTSIICTAAYLRVPTFGKEKGILNYTKSNDLSYAELVMVVIHEIFGHHAADVAASLTPFSKKYNLSKQEEIYWKTYKNPIMDEGKPLTIEYLFAHEGIFNDEQRVVQQAYALRRAIRGVADLGVHTNRMNNENAYRLFSKVLGDSDRRAKAEVLRIYRSPLESASYILGMNELLRIHKDMYKENTKRFLKDILPLPVLPNDIPYFVAK